MGLNCKKEYSSKKGKDHHLILTGIESGVCYDSTMFSQTDMITLIQTKEIMNEVKYLANNVFLLFD